MSLIKDRHAGSHLARSGRAAPALRRDDFEPDRFLAPRRTKSVLLGDWPHARQSASVCWRGLVVWRKPRQQPRRRRCSSLPHQAAAVNPRLPAARNTPWSPSRTGTGTALLLACISAAAPADIQGRSAGEGSLTANVLIEQVHHRHGRAIGVHDSVTQRHERCARPGWTLSCRSISSLFAVNTLSRRQRRRDARVAHGDQALVFSADVQRTLQPARSSSDRRPARGQRVGTNVTGLSWTLSPTLEPASGHLDHRRRRSGCVSSSTIASFGSHSA